MKIKGADFLKARKLDKELEMVITNLFGKKYTVNIEEKITAQEVEAFKNNEFTKLHLSTLRKVYAFSIVFKLLS